MKFSLPGAHCLRIQGRCQRNFSAFLERAAEQAPPKHVVSEESICPGTLQCNLEAAPRDWQRLEQIKVSLSEGLGSASQMLELPPSMCSLGTRWSLVAGGGPWQICGSAGAVQSFGKMNSSL